jgi:hypothetical protein
MRRERMKIVNAELRLAGLGGMTAVAPAAGGSRDRMMKRRAFHGRLAIGVEPDHQRGGRAMVIRALAVFTLAILAGGCASAAPVHVYSKPGATLEQMTRDEAECAGGAGGSQASPERLCATPRGLFHYS